MTVETEAGRDARMAFVLRLREEGVASLDVLRALETIPREQFVPWRHVDLSWRDVALPIACGQIMPGPLLVARMMEAMRLTRAHSVLEIGGGSGYTTAMLARLAGEVVSLERFRTLVVESRRRIADVPDIAERCDIRWADALALPAQIARYDRIVVHATLDGAPVGYEETLRRMLKPEGLLVCGRSAGPNGPARLVMRRTDGAQSDIAPYRLTPLEPGLAGAL